jgi:hypothetical protein
MENIDKNKSLCYYDSDGASREVKNCKLTTDKAGRYWLWCETLKHNLAYKARTREDAFMLAIDSLLFTIKLKDEQLAALDRISQLANAFADQIKPDNDDD